MRVTFVCLSCGHEYDVVQGVGEPWAASLCNQFRAFGRPCCGRVVRKGAGGVAVSPDVLSLEQMNRLARGGKLDET